MPPSGANPAAHGDTPQFRSDGQALGKRDVHLVQNFGDIPAAPMPSRAQYRPASVANRLLTDGRGCSGRTGQRGRSPTCSHVRTPDGRDARGATGRPEPDCKTATTG